MANRRKNKEERVEEISNAAKIVFFKKGYFNSTVDEIAKLAGVSKGTVYLYFNNKDELYVSLITPMIEELTRLLLDLENRLIEDEINNAADFFQAFYTLFSDLYKFDPEALRIFQVYLSTELFAVMPPKTRNKLWMSGKRNIRIARGIITSGIKLGLLPDTHPMKLFVALWSSFLGIVQWEDSKYRISGKHNYVFDSLQFSFSLIAKGLGVEADRD